MADLLDVSIHDRGGASGFVSVAERGVEMGVALIIMGRCESAQGLATGP